MKERRIEPKTFLALFHNKLSDVGCDKQSMSGRAKNRTCDAGLACGRHVLNHVKGEGFLLSPHPRKIHIFAESPITQCFPTRQRHASGQPHPAAAINARALQTIPKKMPEAVDELVAECDATSPAATSAAQGSSCRPSDCTLSPPDAPSLATWSSPFSMFAIGM